MTHEALDVFLRGKLYSYAPECLPSEATITVMLMYNVAKRKNIDNYKNKSSILRDIKATNAWIQSYKNDPINTSYSACGLVSILIAAIICKENDLAIEFAQKLKDCGLFDDNVKSLFTDYVNFYSQKITDNYNSALNAFDEYLKSLAR